MSLAARFTRLLSTLLLAAALGGAVAAPKSEVAAASEQAGDHLDLMLFRLKMFHQEARNSILATLDLDLFRDYFSLPESLQNRYDEMGTIRLTPEQDRIRRRLERWVLSLHERFPIGETCLIDRHGQEHMRVVGGKVEKPVHFSDEEHGAPFFEPSFRIRQGEVHVSEPYMSADAFRWVIAFTSPVVLKEGEKPAFYHFEVPLEIHQQLVGTVDYAFDSRERATPDSDEEGRNFILDRESGLLIADSRQHIDYELKAERHPEKNPNLPHYLPPEQLADYLPAADSISSHPAFLDAIDEIRKGGQGVRVLELSDRSYVLAYAPVPGRKWSVGHLDPVGGHAFWTTPAKN